MDIKKGISYIAFGFLFTLLNINLNFNGTSINITPDFVGWILMFLAFDHLGQYVENKGYLKWIALILAILTGVIWVYGLVKPELSIDTVKTVVSFAGVVFMFILFGVLEEVARDKAPIYVKNISMLKILGYTGAEAGRIYNYATAAVVVVALIVTTPLAERLMKILYHIFMKKINGWLPYYIPSWMFVAIPAIGIGCYLMIHLLLSAKVRRVQLAGALRSME